MRRNKKKIYGIYDPERNTVIRKHNQERGVHFTPSQSRGCPVSLRYLTSQRRTVQRFGDGSIREEKENWRDVKGVTERKALRGPTDALVGRVHRVPVAKDAPRS